MRFSILILFTLFSFFVTAKDNIEKANWKGKISAKSIVINNQYGDIRLRYGGDEDILEYVVVTQNLQIDKQLYIERNETTNVFYLTTYKKKSHNKQIDVDLSRIDITVFVPKGKMLQVRTDEGAIDAKGLRSDLSIMTENGNINVRKQSGNISTINNSGKTRVVLKNLHHEKPQIFESVFGKIIITISDTSDFSISMSTSGDIISDFSLEMKKHINQEPNKTAIINNNKASSEIIMRSKRGVLALKEHREF